MTGPVDRIDTTVLDSVEGEGYLMSLPSELGAEAVAWAAVQPVAADAMALSFGRLAALVAALLGLAAVALGGLALVRPTARTGVGSQPNRARIALAAGLVGAALGGLVVATADGGLGTGNGLGGGVVALLLGLAGAALGGRALARSRTAGRRSARR